MGTGRASLEFGAVTMPQGHVVQDDYWKLVYSARHHNSEQAFWMLFDEPLGEIYGIELAEDSRFDYTASYLGADLEPIGEVTINQIERELLGRSRDDLEAHVAVIPAAAFTAGLGDSTWLTNAAVYLPPEMPLQLLHLYFLREFGGKSADPGYTIFAQGGKSLSLHNLVRDTFGYLDSVGAVLISSSLPIFASSRTFNNAPSGTYGQFIPAIPLDQAIQGDDEHVLIQLTSNDAFRTNIGYVNLGPEDLELEIKLHDESGSVIDSWTSSFFGWEFRQDTDVFGDHEINDGYATVRATNADAQFMTYASVVDNISGDPIFVPVAKTINDQIFIPAAAHIGGANNTSWRTDVEVMNPGDELMTLSIDWLHRGATVSRSLELAPHHAVRLEDIVADFFGSSGSGALRIEAQSGLVYIGSRTYNDLGIHSYGQYIPGMRADEAINHGETGRLLQLSNSESSMRGFRTNVGFLNISDQTIDVVVEFFDADGGTLGYVTTVLEPFEWLQRNDALNVIDAGDQIDAYALVSSTSEGAHFLAYASVVDNRSGDPVFIPALQ